MDRFYLLIGTTALLWSGTKAEEESILSGATVSDFDIYDQMCPDPDVLIGTSFKSGVQTTTYTHNGSY